MDKVFAKGKVFTVDKVFTLRSNFAGLGFLEGNNKEKDKKILEKRRGASDSQTYANSGSPSEYVKERFESCLWLTISDIINREPVTVQEDTPLEEVFALFGKYPYHLIPVVNKKNELVGTIDLDVVLEMLILCMVPREKYTHLTAVRSLGTKAKEIMITHPVTIFLNSTLKEASDLMLRYRVDRICVIENGKLAGIVSKRDLVKEICRKRKEEKAKEKVQ